MAIIYSYPIATPKSKDLLVGTSVFDENDPSSERTNPTVSFTVQSLINLIGPIIGTPNLQQVTGAGNTTTNSITITKNAWDTYPTYDEYLKGGKKEREPLARSRYSYFSLFPFSTSISCESGKILFTLLKTN